MLPTEEQKARIREAARALARAINEVHGAVAEIDVHRVEVTNMEDAAPKYIHTIAVRLTSEAVEIY